MSIRVKVNRQGNCPYCASINLQAVEALRPDRTAMQCGGCDYFSIRHINGAQYPLEDRTDYTAAPLVVAVYSE